jgi:hypothetical protein
MMADATRTPTYTPQEVPPPRSVSLHMSFDEARALYIVARHVGGSPDKSPRGHIDAILTALRKVGGTFGTGNKGRGEYVTPESGIMFLDYDRTDEEE